MCEPTSSQKGSAITDLDPEELQRILETVQDYLAFRQVLHKEGFLFVDDNLAFPDPPSLEKLGALADWLKMSSAPLRRSIGVGGIRGLILRLFNLPVRLFGSEQVIFNRRLREYIDELTGSIESLNAQEAALKSAVISLDRALKTNAESIKEIMALVEINKSLREENKKLVERIDS